MSAPPPPSLPSSQRSAGKTTIVIAVALVLVLAVTGAGLAGWAAWTAFRDGDDRGGSQAASPPESSSTAQPESNPAELDDFYEQDLDWRNCGQNECTRLTVPLDYADPDAETITIAVLRVPATSRDKRVGQLVVNPGGPGASGVDYAASGQTTFGKQLTRFFDIVGFDPRGVGKSTPLECAGTRQTDELLSADPDPETPAEVARLGQLMREFGEGCLANSGDLTRHVSTVEAAKDMDILRAALGERQLDYLGASYGTLLGATYADLFPSRVRRMVLDGAIDPSLSYEQLTLGQARGFEVALRAYLENCIAAGDCPLGDSVEAATSRIAQLLEQIDAEPLPTDHDRELTEGLAVLGIVLPLYAEDYWPLLTIALRQALAGGGNQLLALSDLYSRRGSNGYNLNLIEALNAVNCLDHSDAIPIAEIPSHFGEFTKASPTFGRVFAYTVSTCAAWPVKSGNRTTALDAEGAPPIVVVGTTRDPATPYEQAVALAKQLQSGVLVSRDGDGHTGFGQGNECVDHAIEDFLVGGTVPEDGLSC